MISSDDYSLNEHKYIKFTLKNYENTDYYDYHRQDMAYRQR